MRHRHTIVNKRKVFLTDMNSPFRKLQICAGCSRFRVIQDADRLNKKVFTQVMKVDIGIPNARWKVEHGVFSGRDTRGSQEVNVRRRQLLQRVPRNESRYELERC